MLPGDDVDGNGHSIKATLNQEVMVELRLYKEIGDGFSDRPLVCIIAHSVAAAA